MKSLDSASGEPKTGFVRTPKVLSAPANNSALSRKTEISLLKPVQGKKPKSAAKRIFLILAIVILFLSGFALNRAASLSKKIFAGQTTTFFGRIWEAVRGASGRVALKGENQGQINILFLGIGGPGHEGPYLTDTMILAQIRPKNSEIVFISIPRDWLAELPDNLGPRKINAVFAEGLVRKKDWSEAGRWSKMAVERLSGQTIPYFAVIDFEGFKKAIDEINGLDIYIDKTFTDAEFPDEKLGLLPPLAFAQGWEHMDGTRALQFARSRHSNNNEGSDFARGLRQQKVMKAFKDKVLELKLMSSPGELNRLLGIFAENFHTNLNPGEILRVYGLVKEQNIQTFLSLNLGLETGLVCPDSDPTAGYVLIPCLDKQPGDIRNFFKNAFALGKLGEEKAVVWLGDSTHKPDALQNSESRLKTAGLTVWKLDYEKNDLPQTIVYQLNPKPATLEFIKNILEAKEVSLPPPGVKADPNKVDLIVILGKNQDG